METRIIKTKIYRDKIFRRLSFKEKFITIYLLTNEFLECLPAIFIDIEILAFNTNTTSLELKKLINEKLHYFQIYFLEDFLIIGDKFTYANYKGGKTEKKKKDLYNSLPLNIKNILSERGEIAQSLPNNWATIEHINHKPEIINNKLENKKQKFNVDNVDYEKVSKQLNTTIEIVKQIELEIRDYCLSIGKPNKYKNIEATIRNWYRRDSKRYTNTQNLVNGLSYKAQNMLIEKENKRKFNEIIDKISKEREEKLNIKN